MKIPEKFCIGTNDDYTLPMILIISVFFDKFIENRPLKSKEETENYFLENGISLENIKKSDILLSKLLSFNNDEVKKIQIQSCLELYYRVEFLKKRPGLYNHDYGNKEDAYRLYIRIIDCLLEAGTAINFGKEMVTSLDSKVKEEIVDYCGYTEVDSSVFNDKNVDSSFIVGLNNDSNKRNKDSVIFAIGYLIYTIRNKYVHCGLPLPLKFLEEQKTHTIDSNISIRNVEVMFFDLIKEYNENKENKIFVSEYLWLLNPNLFLLKKICRNLLMKKIDEMKKIEEI